MLMLRTNCDYDSTKLPSRQNGDKVSKKKKKKEKRKGELVRKLTRMQQPLIKE